MNISFNMDSVVSHFSQVELCNIMDCSPPLSMGFSRQEHWCWLPFPSPGNFPNPAQTDYLTTELLGRPPKGAVEI